MKKFANAISLAVTAANEVKNKKAGKIASFKVNLYILLLYVPYHI